MRLLVEAANGAVGVARGRIVAPIGAFDVTIRVRDGEIRPGLINAHDHLHRNHYGRLGFPPYANAYEWGRDIHLRCAEDIEHGRALPLRRALLRGAWKNLLAGVTTVVHHDRWEPELERFPLRVQRVRCADSLGLDPEAAELATGAGPCAIHLAEGSDEAGADEVRELDRRGLLGPDLMAVHVVGADADGVRRLRASGCAIVWCPSSNLFLLGRTAPRDLLAPGVDVLVGSDSLLSADGTLLDELRVARGLGYLADERLLDAVGTVAAHRLGVPEPSLAPGARADLAVFRRPVLEATAEDVAVVVAGGVLRALDPALLPALGRQAARGRVLRAFGVERWIDQRVTVPRNSRSARFR